jgi:hypothetical protein
MKKLINFCLIASTIIFSPALRAQGYEPMKPEPEHAPLDEIQSDEPDKLPKSPEEDIQGDGPVQTPLEGSHPNQDDSTTPLTPPTVPSDESTIPEATPSDDEEGTPVGQAASEGSKAAKRKQWQNIALATAAVVVAVTALILIANNDGHRSDD